MADVKWIKLQTDVFDNRKIKVIESMPDGDTIIVIWMKLLCMAGQINDQGFIYLTSELPYTDEMLATVIERPLSTVRLALQTFEQLHMIEIVDNFIQLPSWERYQNIEGLERVREQNRLRKQRQRIREKEQLQLTCHVTSRDSHDTDKNREEIEIDKNIYSPSKSAPLIEELFLQFWKVYPKKVGKQDALKAFKKINPNQELVEQMISVIDKAKHTTQWTKNNGQYIPNPSTWLNQGRWEDDVESYEYKTSAEGREIRYADIDF